jgi:hypothetical protein
VFDERLGGEVRAAWTAAEPGANGTLTADRPAIVDGRTLRRFPSSVASGPHAVQSLEHDWSKLIFVPPGEEFRVSVPASSSSATVAKQSQHPIALAITSGVLLAGAGGCAYGAYAQNDVMAAAANVGSLDDAYSLQGVLGWSAVGLGVAGVTAGALYFVF